MSYNIFNPNYSFLQSAAIPPLWSPSQQAGLICTPNNLHKICRLSKDGNAMPLKQRYIDCEHSKFRSSCSLWRYRLSPWQLLRFSYLFSPYQDFCTYSKHQPLSHDVCLCQHDWGINASSLYGLKKRSIPCKCTWPLVCPRVPFSVKSGTGRHQNRKKGCVRPVLRQRSKSTKHTTIGIKKEPQNEALFHFFIRWETTLLHFIVSLRSLSFLQ